MPRRLMLALTWVAATLVAVFVAVQAVDAVGRQVTDRPAAVARRSPTTTALPTTISPTTTTTAPSVDSAATPSAATSAGSSETPRPAASGQQAVPQPQSSTPVAPAPAGTPETQEAGSSDSPSSEPPATYGPTTTYDLEGGSIGVRCAGTTIELVYSSPAPGFTADVNSSGPQEVDVRFESDTNGSRINVQCPSGSPVVTDEREDDS